MFGASVVNFTIFLVTLLAPVFLAVAIFKIWQNGNRTNRLLALIAQHQNIPSHVIKDVYENGGGRVSVSGVAEKDN
ncbi:MAG: hypothetical protein ACNI27_02630 [Desulfovibrio sp.]